MFYSKLIKLLCHAKKSFRQKRLIRLQTGPSSITVFDLIFDLSVTFTQQLLANIEKKYHLKVETAHGDSFSSRQERFFHNEIISFSLRKETYRLAAVLLLYCFDDVPDDVPE
jgi:hypothetical protein